ncbi:MAG: hypothetical protein ACREBU_23335, partial [Nitrososphaera sp.]
MALLSLDEHIDYLETKRGLAKTTIRNYRYAAKHLNITNINTDALADLWTYLSSQLPEYGADGSLIKNGHYAYVFHANSAISSLLSMHGLTAKGSEYDVLREKLGRLKHVPEGYTEEQLKTLLKASKWSARHFGLYRLLIFLIYTGVRISSAANVRFSDFKQVEGVDGVWAVRVVGKGRKYDAIISAKALEHMKLWNPYYSDLITGFNPKIMKSSFANYNRSLLVHAIMSKGISQDVTINTAIFHSIRKAF